MVDPKDKKIMPNKRDMIFIRKKGIQQQPSTTEEEVDAEDVEGEKADHKVNVAHEGAAEGEVRPSYVKRSKIDKLQHEFDEFKAKTNSNFAAVR